MPRNSWLNAKALEALSKAEINVPSSDIQKPKIQVFGKCVGKPPDMVVKVHMHARDQITIRVEIIGGWREAHLEHVQDNQWNAVLHPAPTK